jgi:hypothetical protein
LEVIKPTAVVFESIQTILKGHLDKQTFTKAWNNGSSMAYEEVVTYALKEISVPIIQESEEE